MRLYSGPKMTGQPLTEVKGNKSQMNYTEWRNHWKQPKTAFPFMPNRALVPCGVHRPCKLKKKDKGLGITE